MSKIEVFIRGDESVDTNLLGTCRTAMELRDLLALVKEWGVYAEGEVRHDITPQFVLDQDDAYVELVVSIES